MLWNKKKKKEPFIPYDPAKMKPAVRVSICTGEKVAGFQDINNGRFTEICLIRSEADLDRFRKDCGICGEIKDIY